MGVDVGVVRINYLQRPREPTYSFLYELAGDNYCDFWGGGWEGNAFLEITRRRMLSKARSYAKRKALPEEDLEKVIWWVKGLPWDGDTVMLHLNW